MLYFSGMAEYKNRFQNFIADNAARADWIGLCYVHEVSNGLHVRDEKPAGCWAADDEGVMIETLVDGQIGYAGTGDLSPAGLRQALDQAIVATQASAAHKIFGWDPTVRPRATGTYRSPKLTNIDVYATGALSQLLLDASAAMRVADAIVSRTAYANIVETSSLYLSSNDSDIAQDITAVFLGLEATAGNGAESQQRSRKLSSHQQGAEAFDAPTLQAAAIQTATEALELLAADNCPSGTMDLIAMPDQMDLQVHESIGHPLELDRILGDERNYAGWSFVKPADFGTLRYGSPLMNISFDPTFAGELASYAFDDGGNAADKAFLIKDGILVRGLGSLESQRRLGIPGVANFRASSWNRAPIDRMANINIEPGGQTLAEMIADVKRGILMSTNRSWSIDDYRDKFQFGCEYARLIENGKLTRTVKNPNYRGQTTAFWNKLAGVGRADLRASYGTPYCGKGEPNQIIRVGHVTPPCLFRDVDVFGGLS